MTDVKDLHDWMVQHLSEHPLFERIPEEKLVSLLQNIIYDNLITHVQIYYHQISDPIVEKLYESTEEGQKVSRNKGNKFLAVFRRISDPYLTSNS